MKPYGLPRLCGVSSPDLGDIHEFGLKSSKSRVPSKSGDIKNSFRKSKAKRATRRVWKKKERLSGKRDCQT